MFTPPRRAPVRLLSACGQVWTYPSLLAFVKAHGLDWIARSIGPHFRVSECLSGTYERIERHHPFVLRSAVDEILSLEDCRRASWEAEPRRPRWLARDEFWNGVGPVPGTGKRPAGQHYFRRIRTFGSHRAAAGVDHQQGEPAFRAARHAYLPTAWDDPAVSARRDRSWKRHRRTRWKESKTPVR